MVLYLSRAKACKRFINKCFYSCHENEHKHPNHGGVHPPKKTPFFHNNSGKMRADKDSQQRATTRAGDKAH